jgi:hypothetical protein
MNATLGDLGQNAWLTPEEAGALLDGTERGEAWAALSEEEQEAALAATAADVRTVTWRGELLFDDQPWPLPTDELCSTYGVVAADASEADLVVAESLRHSSTAIELAGGAVHVLGPVADGDYRKAAPILRFDRQTGALTLGEGLSESPAGKRLLVVAPLPTALRRGLAIQAVERARSRQHHELADALHRGVAGFGPNLEARDRGGRMVCHVDAYWLMAPYLARGLRAERA